MNNSIEIIKSIFEIINIELINIDGEIITFKDKVNNKEYSYKSSYPSRHFYTEDDTRYFRCIQNGKVINYMSGGISLKENNNKQKVFGIRFSEGIDSNNICISFYDDNSDKTILFGRKKNGIDYIRLTRLYKPKGNNTIGNEISLECFNNNKELNIYDFNEYIKTTMTIKDNKFTLDLVGNDTNINIRPVDVCLNNSDINCLIGTLIVNRREIVDDLFNKFMIIGQNLYDYCKEVYPFFSSFEQILSTYNSDSIIDEVVNKYSEIVRESKELIKKIENNN